jgi:ATP-dependent helicase/nuclease subunit A
LDRDAQNAEENRLLYVAATRARDLLVVSTYEEKPEISPWSPFEAHLPDVPVINIMKKFVLPL